VISKSTDEKALKLLKQLDEKLLSLNDVEKQQAFIKNQVNLVDKYLKQFLLKNAPKNRYECTKITVNSLVKLFYLDFMNYYSVIKIQLVIKILKQNLLIVMTHSNVYRVIMFFKQFQMIQL
jgi:hypothetical protein